MTLTTIFTLFYSVFTLVGSVLGLGPPFTGDEFVKLKELPPMSVIARSSGSLSLACSCAGKPTPQVAWYKDGVKISGTEGSPGGLGEAWARLSVPCATAEHAGVYQCVGEAAGRQVSTSTKVDVVGHPHGGAGCLPRGHIGSAPKISGWYNAVMIQSGKTARLACDVDESAGKLNVVWRDGMGEKVEPSESIHFKGTDLIISEVNWSHMGRFTCTVENGFGVDMISTFLYPLAPALTDLDTYV